MSRMISPMDLYEAARETCLRLYVANGGDRRDLWNVQPYPGTAAISQTHVQGRRVWTLCMPALPMDVLVPRWQADLISAYTVHELLHALWTDFNVSILSRVEGIHDLVNALEDNRIEARAGKGALVNVSEARRLLQALNLYVWEKALASPNFDMASPRQFSFILNMVIFAEKLGYVSTFPSDWRAKVDPVMLPLFDHALVRFDALASTQDVLVLARELRDMAKNLKAPPPPATKPGDKPKPGDKGDEPKGDEHEGDEHEHEHEGDEPKGGKGDKPKGDEPKGDKPKGDKPKGDKGDEHEGDEHEGDEHEGDEPKGDEHEGDEKGAGEPASGEPGKGDNAPAGDKPAAGEAPKAEGTAKGEHGASLAAPRDLSDSEQDYSEVNLNELGTQEGPTAEHLNANAALNAPPSNIRECDKRGNVKAAGAAISAPAKLRRHVTSAVKSPERVGHERFQTTGRLDMHNLAGLSTGAANVYRRRVEDDGIEAAVSILLDISSSMGDGNRIEAARAMALHMGDALKAAGVRFEIAAFSAQGGHGATMWFPKPFSKGWNDEAKRFTAGLRPTGGTTMLPAIKTCAERLGKVTAVTRRILVVLTDGLDAYEPGANAAHVKHWRAKGVEIIGIGLMLTRHDQDSMRESFAGHAVIVNDCAALSTVGLAELGKALDKGAPRAA